MRVQIHIKQLAVQIAVPTHQTIKWLIEAALIWHQQITRNRIANDKCVVKRANGQLLDDGSNVQLVLREGESVYIYLPQDIQFINMGR